MTEKIPLKISLPQSVWNKLEKIAVKNKITLDELIEFIIAKKYTKGMKE